jgi:hypothetical protein
MGIRKKEIVVAQLKAIGVVVNDRVSKMIDNVASALNEKDAWLLTQAKDDIKTLLESK